MKWKVCGMRDLGNIEDVAACEPDFMGFIWAPKSPRYVGEDFIIPDLPKSIKAVGVFVDASVEKIAEMAKRSGFEWVQLHGQESANDILKLKSLGLKVIKAISVSNENDLLDCVGEPDLFLLDTKKGEQVGGTGITFDWTILKAYKKSIPFILAGGLGEENVAEAISLSAQFPIYALDFNSKLESMPGFKNIEKVKNISKIIDR
jgi:phosphoribosylanthranilate isomerase